MQHSDGAQQQEGRLSTTPSSIAALSAITTSHPAVSQLRVAGRVPVVTAAPAIGVVAAGQQGVLTTVTGARPVAMSPQAVMVPTQTVSRLLSPSTSLSANTVQIPATLNVLQRQLSAPGVVGLSAVSAQDLQQVLQQATQQSITLLTATEAVAESQQRPRLARPLSFPHSSPSLPAVSSMSATGATIHHHGQSPVRGAVPVMAATLSHSNLQHSLLGMNLNTQQQQQLSAAQRRAVTTTAATTTTTTTSAIAVIPATSITQSRTVFEVRAPSGQPPSLRTASGAPPRKKMRLEEKPPPNAEVGNYRKQLIEVKHKQMKELKSEYFENLTEMFFLQSGQNLIDYHTWKKRPTPQLVSFLTSGKLDSDEEEDVLQVKEINSEVKVLTNPGSNVPLATPVAISTTLPPMVSALSQQVVAPSAQTASAGSTTTSSATASQAIASSSSFSSSAAVSASATTSSQLQQQLSKALDSKAASKGQIHSLKQSKSPPMSPNQRLHTRQQSLSAVYDNLSGSSQEVIVERAKQEAQVVQRVAELRKEGLWSSKRLPRVQEPLRQKAHWDYLLEEMTWLAADFIQERKWKKATARKVARMVSNYFKEQEQKELKAEKEEATKLKKIASHMAKMVKEFWSNIEKVVQYKQQMRLEEKKKRALDLHLNFIVDQTEKYSTWLTEGLQNASSVNGSVSTSPSHSSDAEDFEPSENSTDDEETIQKEEDEAEGNEQDEKQELEDLQKEGDLPLEELLKTLPQEVLDAPAPIPPPLPEGMEDVLDSNDEENGEEEGKEAKAEETEEKEGGKSSEDKEAKEQDSGDKDGSDKEFTGAEEDAMDVEDTIDEQEKLEKRDYQSELQDLADEGEMSIEELAAKYAGAYDSDFEMPEDSSSEEDSEQESDEFEIETGSSSQEESQKEEEEDEVKEKKEHPGLEELMKPPQAPSPPAAAAAAAASISATDQPAEAGKKEEKEEVINDIAAQALSLQPKGYTLETTEVKTKVPHLLKHKLREYQHVGLDWLATMHDKHLNGILADEMGLGKTIQTIALLAHLACEKGNWGPHLIVVPTSVMLNWEMELKKWCPAFKILTYYGNQKERKLKRQGWTKTNAFHVCITSYKLVVQDHQAFRRKKWKYLILDEAQNIKNFKSQRWQMLLNFSSQRRLLLTGTPLQNSLMELWSLMHFLMPHVFQSHRDFKEWFSNPLTGMIEGSQEYNESLIKRLHKVLRPFLLRRLKNEVEKQMPQKYEHVVMCRLSKRQRFLYDDFMSQTKTKETLASGHYMSVINILMQLRKVCNHPNLFDPRPVVSPLSIQGLTYNTASAITTALHKDPLDEVDMRILFPNLAEMERDLPAFVAHRVKQLTTASNLIEEVDYHPDPPPSLPKGQLKPGALPMTVPLLQMSGRASPVAQGRVGSPVEVVKVAASRSATPPVLAVPRPISSQATVLLPSSSSATLSLTSVASAPITANAVSLAAIPQVRSTSGQTLLLTSVARSGVSSALVLTSTAAATAVTATTGIPSTAVISTTAISCAPLTSTLQAKVLPQPAQGSSAGGGSAVLATQPITVQIQQTNQGTRLMIPTGQLSQLPASLFQIVQTSSGQHLVATSTPTSTLSAQVSAVVPVTSTASTVNGPSTPTTVAATGGQSLVTTAVSQLKTLTSLSTTAPISTPSSSAITTCASSTTVVSSSGSKPVMRVSPMVASTSSGTVTTIAAPGTTTTTTTSSLPLSVVSSMVSTLKSVMSPKKRSELFLEPLYEKRKRRRKEKLKRLARVNGQHCSQTPVYGPDLIETLTLATDLCSQCHRERHWLRSGYASCQCVLMDHNRHLPKYYWHETNHLSDLIRTPEQRLLDLKNTLDRFAFCIPTVISPGIQLRVAHPDPSAVLQERRLKFDIHEQLRPVMTCLNDLRMRMTMHFPELRLIQYDCGKLQTMDVLLRKLKSGGHRVLIFTQMTKMLDVLEAFLNYHGHRYLRLDGTTRVEQRQALMDRFNADKRIFCFILSTRSGGIGVNLTGADTVIFYDSDWNPTMDAQAQDRCHRIGQTRDVHIYRLISEMTVEENILKKANQKRLLGDLAIEGGNFTTAFFKEQTIKDLFAQPSGLKALTEDKEVKEVKDSPEESMEVEEPPPVSRKPGGKDKEANIVAAFEQALCKAEDETDAIAANLVKAEQKAELADFDESIPWDEKEAEARKEEDEMSRAEIELAMLDKELSGIERYAVAMMETQMEDDVLEELKMAEEDMENSKKDWELTRLKALKEEEERRAKLEEDEMLYTYLRDDAQTFINVLDGSEMPMWAPPTPPQDDNDVYVDPTMLFLYEGSVMSESQLPPVYVRKDHRKPRVETITTRKQKQRKEEAPQVPRSLFDRPNSALVKMRRELKIQRLKAGMSMHPKQPLRPTSLPGPLSHKTPAPEQSEGHPEWLIHEDWALLQAVSDCCQLPFNLTNYQNGHLPNWDLVADVVNGVSRTHRSIKQCKARYENVIIPREEGRILYDVSPRKQKKNKSTYKTKNNRPMKTSQLFTQDNSSSITLLYSLRFDSVKSMATKRPAPTRQTLNNPSLKNLKHLAVLQENNISYDQPLNALQVAAIRSERIQREKKASSAANASAEAAQQQQRPAQGGGVVGERGGAVPAVGGVAASAPTVAQAVAGQQLHSLVSAATPTTIIAGAATPRAAVAQGMTAVSIARTLAATGNIVAVTGSLGRGRVQVHDITTVAGTVTGAQVAAQTARATLQPSAPANITQKMAAMAGTSALAGGTVHQQIAKGLNQPINLLHPIMRSQAPGGTASQAQHLGHKVRLTKQAAVVRTVPGITEDQLKALKVRQLQNKAQGGQQVKFLQGQMQPVGQSGTTSAAPVTLVKSVPAPAGASAVPIPVSINVTMAQGQQKTAPSSRGPTVSQLQHQRMQLLQQQQQQQQRKAVPMQHSQRVTSLGAVRGAQIPLLMSTKSPLTVTGQLLHQYIKQQPNIISVSQAQTLTPTMVAKVSLPHSTPIHTLAAAAGSPITVTQVAATTPSAGGSGVPSHHTPTVATINMANVSAATHATVVKTATLATVDPGQGTKMATLAQSLVTPQPLQITSSALQPAQAATLVGAGGTQHRVLTATPTTLPQATAVVVSSTASLTQPAATTTTTTTIMQQQQPAAQQIVSAATVVSAQAVASPSAMATVVTQTQSPQGPSTTQASSASQLTAQQQQQLQKGPYAMRTRNQPKHS